MQTVSYCHALLVCSIKATYIDAYVFDFISLCMGCRMTSVPTAQPTPQLQRPSSLQKKNCRNRLDLQVAVEDL